MTFFSLLGWLYPDLPPALSGFSFGNFPAANASDQLSGSGGGGHLQFRLRIQFGSSGRDRLGPFRPFGFWPPVIHPPAVDSPTQPDPTPTYILFGLAGDDRLEGGAATDFLFGDRGNDQLFGRDGDDFLFGGPGYDYLNGGPGYDTVSYAAATAAVSLRYVLPPLKQSSPEPYSPQKPASKPPDESRLQGELRLELPGKIDVLAQIERILAPADSPEPNRIDFSDLEFSASQEHFGDAGNPFRRAAPAIQIDLAAAQLQFEEKVPIYLDPSGLQQQQIAIENFQDVFGSYGDDEIRGDEQNNLLDGFFGRDRLSGGPGDDTLIGNGDDILSGGAGADVFRLGAAWAEIIEPGGRTRPIPLQTTVLDFEQGLDQLALVRQTSLELPLFAVSPTGWVGGGAAALEEAALGDAVDLPPGSRIRLRGFEDLDLGSLISSRFQLITRPSEIPPEQTGIFYNPDSGALFYQGASVPTSLTPLQVATIPGLRPSAMMVLARE